MVILYRKKNINTTFSTNGFDTALLVKRSLALPGLFLAVEAETPGLPNSCSELQS
jgi:hypothetical protein